MSRSLVWTLFLLTGCPDWTDIGVGEGEGEGEDKPSFVTSEEEISIEEGDLGELEIEIDDETSAFLVTVEGEYYVDVEYVVDPDGETVFDWEDWYDESTSLTEAIFPYYHDATFNWPIRERDGRLSEGTWTVYLGSYSRSGYARADDLDVTIHRKRDSSFSSGAVGVRVVYADGVGDDEDVVAGVEGAVERWREIWAAYNIDLDEEYAQSDIDEDLPIPYSDSSGIREIAEDTDGRQVTVIIGETIEGSEAYYGVTGGIPAPLTATPRAAIVVSWLANAGGDGRFSDDDIRLFGETLAHETGHYVGLFHPVETTWNYWDALSDTDECGRMSECEDALGENLMFPYPVCTYRECVPQDQMTDGQVGVKMRYTGTR